MNIQDVQALGDRLLENMGRVIVGKDAVIRLTLTALLAGGHVLLEDVPGTGKTVLSKSLAASLDGSFHRIQCTPDLLPSDITGQSVFNQKESSFSFHPGPVFTNILLADELNRATPRTQSALLEAMEERQVSVDGKTLPLERPFFVIATQNPIETQGTFPLPEAQLDRFLMRLSMGYPNPEESDVLLQRFLGEAPLERLEAVASKEELSLAQAAVCTVQVSAPVRRYMVALTQATRDAEDVQLGVSPRGMLALLRACRVYAALLGRDYVSPDDVKALVPHVFCHRILLRGSFTGQREKVLSLLDQLLHTVPVPTEELPV